MTRRNPGSFRSMAKSGSSFVHSTQQPHPACMVGSHREPVLRHLEAPSAPLEISSRPLEPSSRSLEKASLRLEPGSGKLETRSPRLETDSPKLERHFGRLETPSRKLEGLSPRLETPGGTLEPLFLELEQHIHLSDTPTHTAVNPSSTNDPHLNMNDTLGNKLSSFLATLAVADQPEYLPIWKDQTPLDFTNELAEARLDVGQLSTDGAVQSAPITGTAEALRLLRENLELRLHVLARVTYKYLKKTGNLEDAAKANLTPSKLHDARAVILAGIGETVLDLAEPLSIPPAVGQPAPGQNGGITAAFVAEVDDLWDRYRVAVGAPTGARSKRKALTAALPNQFRDTEEKFGDLDDLVIQFGTTPLGKQFVAAWFNARHVADLGRRSAKPKEPASPVK